MSGETQARRREAASGQPGGRRPAPGSLTLVQSFINSHFDLEVDRGADLFSTPEGLRHWLREKGLIGPDAGADDVDLERALTVRESLRALASAHEHAPHTALEQLNRVACGTPIEVRFASDGPRYARAVAAGGVDGAIGVILAQTARAMIEGSWERLKICPGDHCGWAFYDHSRNRTGRWCSMSVCGGRAKARAHYQRRIDETEGSS